MCRPPENEDGVALWTRMLCRKGFCDLAGAGTVQVTSHSGGDSSAGRVIVCHSDEKRRDMVQGGWAGRSCGCIGRLSGVGSGCRTDVAGAGDQAFLCVSFCGDALVLGHKITDGGDATAHSSHRVVPPAETARSQEAIKAATLLTLV